MWLALPNNDWRVYEVMPGGEGKTRNFYSCLGIVVKEEANSCPEAAAILIDGDVQVVSLMGDWRGGYYELRHNP